MKKVNNKIILQRRLMQSVVWPMIETLNLVPPSLHHTILKSFFKKFYLPPLVYRNLTPRYDYRHFSNVSVGYDGYI